MFQISLQYNFLYSETLASAFLLEQFCGPHTPLGLLHRSLLTSILKGYILLNIAFWVDSSFLSFKTFFRRYVSSPWPSHFCRRNLQSSEPWLPHTLFGVSLATFIFCLFGSGLGLVVTLSSVYSSSVMVKGFFEFFFLEVLEPVSLCMPQIWGFFSQTFFQIFFPAHVLFSLWDTDDTNVGAFLPSHRPLSVCSLMSKTDHSYWLAFQFTHLSSVISNL